MKQDIKARWVAALRSGKYKQTYGVLRGVRAEDGMIGHCCLGVLCEIAAEDGMVTLDEERSGYITPPDWRRVANPPVTFEGYITPLSVQTWAGLESANPPVTFEDDTDSLAGMNDNGVSFEVIAQVIEEQL